MDESAGTKKITINDLLMKKESNQKITATTAFDFNMARIADESGIDMIITGAATMVMGGRPNTLGAEMEDTLFFLKLAVPGIRRAFVQSSLPYGSYHISNEQAVTNAIKLIKNGVESVKLEGGGIISERVNAISEAGIPVASHLGLTPHYLAKIGGFRSVGRYADEAINIYKDAVLLQEAGAWCIELECVPYRVAEFITKKLKMITIGIGSGPGCDGQLLIGHDVLGLQRSIKTKYAKNYINIWDNAINAYKDYISDVENKIFPASEHCFNISDTEFERFLDIVG